MSKYIDIKEFDYELPDDRIAKFPLQERDSSKLLIYLNEKISESNFSNLSNYIPNNSLIVRNNTRVICARLIFHKATGARIEIFCLEPHAPADYETAFASQNSVQWQCMVGNLKKWKDEVLTTKIIYNGVEIELSATRIGEENGKQIVEFNHNYIGHSFGEVLEILGNIPIPPYLRRDAQHSDSETYQTLYSKHDGSVAAPTAGLHFTDTVFGSLEDIGCKISEVTLHVGAGTFLPVKVLNAAEHVMHTEHFDFTVKNLQDFLDRDTIVAVGTTSVRTIESISVLGYRALTVGDINSEKAVGQWEAYEIPKELTKIDLIGALKEYMDKNGLNRVKASTQIMITPGYVFRVVNILITNFHQPQSTLLLLISAIVGRDKWIGIYEYAMQNRFRFLSYGDSSILFLNK